MPSPSPEGTSPEQSPAIDPTVAEIEGDLQSTEAADDVTEVEVKAAAEAGKIAIKHEVEASKGDKAPTQNAGSPDPAKLAARVMGRRRAAAARVAATTTTTGPPVPVDLTQKPTLRRTGTATRPASNRSSAATGTTASTQGAAPGSAGSSGGNQTKAAAPNAPEQRPLSRLQLLAAEEDENVGQVILSDMIGGYVALQQDYKKAPSEELKAKLWDLGTDILSLAGNAEANSVHHPGQAWGGAEIPEYTEHKLLLTDKDGAERLVDIPAGASGYLKDFATQTGGGNVVDKAVFDDVFGTSSSGGQPSGSTTSSASSHTPQPGAAGPSGPGTAGASGSGGGAGGKKPQTGAGGGGGAGGNTLASGSQQGGDQSKSPETRRSREVLDGDIETLVSMKNELTAGVVSVERLMVLNRLVRASTVRHKGGWYHAPAELQTWSDKTNRWEVTGFMQFAPRKPNGKTWEQADINSLVGDIYRLTEPRENLVRDERTRMRFENIMEAEVVSPVHTDLERETRKQEWQGTRYEEPVGEGWLSLETVGDDEASIKAAIQVARSKDPDLSEEDARAAAIRAAQDGLLRRTDYGKVQDAVFKEVKGLTEYAGKREANPRRLDRILDELKPQDKQDILGRILAGGTADTDKQDLEMLLQGAFDRSGRKIPKGFGEVLTAAMGRFEKQNDGLWRKNASEEARSYMYGRYKELTNTELHLIWREHKTEVGEYYSVASYDKVQMNRMLGVMKIDILGKANMHDSLLAAKRTGAYGVLPIVKLDVSGVRAFGGSGSYEPFMALQLQAMAGAGEHDYGNRFLNFLYDLSEEGEESDRRAGEWLIREGRDKGTNAKGDKKRERFLATQGALKAAAGDRLRLYETIWYGKKSYGSPPFRPGMYLVPPIRAGAGMSNGQAGGGAAQGQQPGNKKRRVRT